MDPVLEENEKEEMQRVLLRIQIAASRAQWSSWETVEPYLDEIASQCAQARVRLATWEERRRQDVPTDP